jgi:predicted bacteriocin transport accessory protein
MKKKILGLLLIVFCLVITGCARTITYKDFEEKIKNKESFVVEIIQNGCSHCENFKPVFDKFAKEYNIEYVKLNLTNLSSEDNQKLNSKYEVSGTPTILIFKKGENQKAFTISGEVPVKTLKTVFKEAGYIK